MKSNAELFRVFGRIGVLSFGGPAAQISVMHHTLVEREKWLSEDQFLRALSLCMLLPGPEAMQLATYAGWRLRGVLGGLIAGLLFVLPGAFIIFALAAIYILFGKVPAVEAAFLGVKAAIIIVVIQALMRLATKALTGPAAWCLAGLAFLGLFLFGLPFPIIILAAAVYGALAGPFKASEPADVPPASGAYLLRTIIVWGALWALPFLILLPTGNTFLVQIGTFFSQLAVVTFGGAYAVLAYMTQTVVQDYGWITTGEMIDALGLAETTPGPLILVTQFVATLAGHHFGGFGLALTAGLLALWVTFIPCFLWIFAAGPFVENLTRRPRLAAALKAITAAVAGVILNLSVWFAMHVLFGSVGTGPLAIPLPDVATLNWPALALTILAGLLMLGLKLGLPLALSLMAAAGVLLGSTGLI